MCLNGWLSVRRPSAGVKRSLMYLRVCWVQMLKHVLYYKFVTGPARRTRREVLVQLLGLSKLVFFSRMMAE